MDESLIVHHSTFNNLPMSHNHSTVKSPIESRSSLSNYRVYGTQSRRRTFRVIQSLDSEPLPRNNTMRNVNVAVEATEPQDYFIHNSLDNDFPKSPNNVGNFHQSDDDEFFLLSPQEHSNQSIFRSRRRRMNEPIIGFRPRIKSHRKCHLKPERDSMTSSLFNDDRMFSTDSPTTPSGIDPESSLLTPNRLCPSIQEINQSAEPTDRRNEIQVRDSSTLSRSNRILRKDSEPRILFRPIQSNDDLLF